MPRPKRTKVVPSKPATRARRASPEAADPPKPAERPFHDLYDVSDQEQETKTIQRVKEDTRKGRLTTVERAGGREEVTSGRDASPNEELEPERLSSSPLVEVGRREKATPATERSAYPVGQFKRRAREPSILGARTGRGRSSSVESNLADDSGLMSVSKKHTTAAGKSTFRNRTRQASVDFGRGTPAHVGSAYKVGTFKRREREPSILRTAQKERQVKPTFDSEDEDDFNPEDESTPLNLSKTKVTSPSGTSSSRKRKLSSIQVPRSQHSQPSPSVPAEADLDADETIPATGPLESENGEEPAPADVAEDPAASIQSSRPVTPELLSDTNAQPRSASSSPDSLLESPPTNNPQRPSVTQGRRTLRPKTPQLATQDSPISSPPSLTHSPNRSEHGAPRGRNRRPVPQPIDFSTAQLQALLPQRRRRQPDPFDIDGSDGEVDTSGLAMDQDELTMSTRPRRRPAKPMARSRPTKTKNQATPVATTVTKAKGKGVKRTYGRAPASDKENDNEDADEDDAVENDETEDSQKLEKRVGRELKIAARKFKEVDKWELEFEEVTASSSSPGHVNAR